MVRLSESTVNKAFFAGRNPESAYNIGFLRMGGGKKLSALNCTFTTLTLKRTTLPISDSHKGLFLSGTSGLWLLFFLWESGEKLDTVADYDEKDSWEIPGIVAANEVCHDVRPYCALGGGGRYRCGRIVPTPPSC